MKNRRIMEGEYGLKGEYHKNINKKWKYYPVYVEKMDFVRAYLDKAPKSSRIADLGCGEGVLVEEYSRKGWNMTGVDYNYSSRYVTKGDLTRLKFKDGSFDLVLSLDVLEHLTYGQQEIAIAEISRVLRKGGRAIVSIPNLAHFASRISFFLFGKLLRTSTIERHKGDRPIGEYIKIFEKNGLKIVRRKGMFPTYPVISLLTYFFPDRSLWLHKIYNLLLAYPNFCFLNILELRKN